MASVGGGVPNRCEKWESCSVCIYSDYLEVGEKKNMWMSQYFICG